MSTADQLLLAKIAAVATRHAARGAIDDMDAAVAELRALASDRTDLLAEHAGICIGMAEAGLPLLAPRFRAEAELAVAAGADEAQIEKWVEVGRERSAQSRRRP